MKKIDSLDRYIQIIEGVCSKGGRYLFRGQLDKDKLLPRFLRTHIDIKNKTIETEEDMFNDFKRRGRPFLRIEPQSQYEWLALSQHHGMPTRLLDWTSTALAALWFTVTDTRSTSDDDGAIWIFNFDKNIDVKEPEKDENPFKIPDTKLFCPTHIEPRFIRQGGWFTIHNYDSGIKELNEEETFKDKLGKFTIPRKCFKEIRFTLNLCGVNQVDLFPDFNGLCEHVAWQNSRAYVERRDRKR